MRSLPLFKYTSRARSTSWMIALCTMFIVASFSVVSGLQASMDSLVGNFEEEFYIVTYPGASAPSMFHRDAVDSVDDTAAFGIFMSVRADPLEDAITVFTVVDEHAILREGLTVDGNETLAGSQLALSGFITLDGVDATVSGAFSSSIFSSSWLFCSHDLMATLAEVGSSEFNFAIIQKPSPGQVAALNDEGFMVQPMMAILGFLQSGVSEVRSATMWVLMPSSFVVAVLMYSFLGSEVIDKRREIGVLKAIGAGRKRLVTYLMTDAFLITAWGAALGLALGIILSYGIATIASHLFTSVFTVEVEERLLLLAYGTTLLAGIAGTLVPAIRSTQSPPVEDLKEAGMC